MFCTKFRLIILLILLLFLDLTAIKVYAGMPKNKMITLYEIKHNVSRNTSYETTADRMEEVYQYDTCEVHYKEAIILDKQIKKDNSNTILVITNKLMYNYIIWSVENLIVSAKDFVKQNRGALDRITMGECMNIAHTYIGKRGAGLYNCFYVNSEKLSIAIIESCSIQKRKRVIKMKQTLF